MYNMKYLIRCEEMKKEILNSHNKNEKLNQFINEIKGYNNLTKIEKLSLEWSLRMCIFKFNHKKLNEVMGCKPLNKV